MKFFNPYPIMKPLLTLLLFCTSFLNYAQTTAREWFDKGYAATNNEDKIYYYDKAIQLSPNDADAYINRGSAKHNLGRYQEAVTDYGKAIQLNPNEALAYYGRGGSKQNLGLYQETITDYDKALQLNPNYTNAYINRGISKHKLGRYKEAIGDYDKSIQLNPNDVDAYYNRGVTKYSLVRYQEAIADYDKAIQLNPNYALAYLAKGRSLVMLGRYCEALPLFTQGERLDNSFSFYAEDKKKAQQQCPPTPISPPSLSKRYALVIGNAAYKHVSSLQQQPATDAQILKNTLEALGFKVTLINELGTKSEMEFAIADFVKKAKNADMLVAYYAGHGIESKGVNYLLPTDVYLKEVEHAEIEAVRLDYVLQKLATCQSKISLVLLDACRNDPFADRPAQERTTDDYRGFRTMESTPGSMVVMYAAEPGRKALNNGVFARGVQQTLRSGVKLTTFMQRLTKNVYDNSSGNQKPTLFGAIMEEYEF